MNWNTLFLLVTIAAQLCVPMVAAEDNPGGSEKLGQVHFPISCNAEAQGQFDRGTALLHSFWYQEAGKAFTAVTEKDPNCAMGHWGIAMSLWYPLWEPPAGAVLKKGLAAVEKAKVVGAKNEREQAYIAATEAFYKDSDRLDHRTRALAYEKAMEQLNLRHPEDTEAAAFYALALNATALPTDKTYANQKKAGRILEKMYVDQPDHPGIAHYIIHSYDYPPLASLALGAARRYAKIAPSVPHALHMPSHIFIRLGLWQESIESNRTSEAAARESGDPRSRLHAMDYLAYAYLQGAQDIEAQRILAELNTVQMVGPESQTPTYAAAAIPARLAIERGHWPEAASLAPRPTRYAAAEAITHFARAIGAARSGQAADARKDVEKLQSLRDTLIEAKQNYWADQVEIQRRAAAAWLAHAEGKNEDALALMRSAADLEDSTEKHPVTPGPIVPARELLGDLLFEAGQPGPALMAYEDALRLEPNRFRGLYGAARAAEHSGDQEKASSYYAELLAICKHADGERPELLWATAFLEKK